MAEAKALSGIVFKASREVEFPIRDPFGRDLCVESVGETIKLLSNAPLSFPSGSDASTTSFFFSFATSFVGTSLLGCGGSGASGLRAAAVA